MIYKLVTILCWESMSCKEKQTQYSECILHVWCIVFRIYKEYPVNEVDIWKLK